ncbi:hypothetical protein SAMN05421690_10876 [Nitrosomonas sp. Nm51]|uniref:hypothetical protein n=1 Tax=Nitrosomonas sp. Nm51 TaxID=133720 RepID=UPI0008B7F5FE|nr:hypothetical protein [Nitrosomonas sp. Nm51]SER81598.1 hypothetical protein SAMN05421690_10876 [Nitrosomonas sp. Nm51]
MAVAVLNVKRRQLLILNEECKTLALLQVEQYKIQKPSDNILPAGRLIICPVRGYAKVYKLVLQLVTEQLKLPQVCGPLLDAVLAATGQTPDLVLCAEFGRRFESFTQPKKNLHLSKRCVLNNSKVSQDENSCVLQC